VNTKTNETKNNNSCKTCQHIRM